MEKLITQLTEIFHLYATAHYHYNKILLLTLFQASKHQLYTITTHLARLPVTLTEAFHGFSEFPRQMLG